MLIDSNILIYAINADSPKYHSAQKFLKENLSNLEIAHQNILETIRILTHQKFSNPMKIKDALNAILAIADATRIIAPNQNTFYITVELIKEHTLSGNRIFDAYLAATALSNGIDIIATDNTKDFFKFKELKIINPFENPHI